MCVCEGNKAGNNDVFAEYVDYAKIIYTLVNLHLHSMFC